MDFRFNYDNIRDQIDRADFGENLDNDGALVKDIKRDMHHRIDRIEDYEKQIKELEYKIKHERARLMETAKNWDI